MHISQLMLKNQAQALHLKHVQSLLLASRPYDLHSI